jgi:hypothetical protein
VPLGQISAVSQGRSDKEMALLEEIDRVKTGMMDEIRRLKQEVSPRPIPALHLTKHTEVANHIISRKFTLESVDIIRRCWRRSTGSRPA